MVSGLVSCRLNFEIAIRMYEMHGLKYHPGYVRQYGGQSATEPQTNQSLRINPFPPRILSPARPEHVK